MANFPTILRSTIPYLSFLSAFGLFIVWNGGVVLGKPLYIYMFEVSLIFFRGQGKPHCLPPYPSNAIYMAILCVLLVSLALPLYPEQRHSTSFSTNNFPLWIYKASITTRYSGDPSHGNHAGRCPLQHHRPPLYSCR